MSRFKEMSGFVIFLLFQLPFCLSRTVLIDITAPWTRSTVSDIAEISEILADLDPTAQLFWKYVDDICAKTLQIDPLLSIPSMESIEELKGLALEGVSQLLPAHMQPFVSTSLSLGAFAPAVQFFLTLSPGDQCQDVSFVTYPGEIVYCSLEEALMSLDTANQEVGKRDIADDGDLSWDHEFKDVVSNADSKIVMYGAIGSSTFCKAHSELSRKARDGITRYSLRHSFNGVAKTDGVTQLKGFGVLLDIKNMEYKNVDDRETATSEDKGAAVTELNDSATFQEGEAVNGVIFSTLLKRKPSLQLELKLLRDTFLDDNAKLVGEKDEMKVWKMRDLGLQVLQAIVSAKDPVEKMADITHNFPMHAPSLSSLKVLPSVKNDVRDLWEKGFSRQCPMNSIFINGKRIQIDGATFNIFDVLGQIKDEYSHMSTLDGMKLPKLLRNKIKALALKLSNSDEDSGAGDIDDIIRVDASKGGKYAITFLNNLERDSIYKRWPKTVRQLLYPSWSLHAIAKNLYTAVLIVDPLTPEGSSLLMQAQMLLQQQYPIRFGVALQCSERTGQAATESWADSMDVCVLFSAMKEKYASLTLQGFLFSLAHVAAGDMLEDDDMMLGAESAAAVGVTREQLVEIYVSAVADGEGIRQTKELFVEANALLSARHTAGYVNGFIVNSTLYINTRGFRANTYSLNGIVTSAPDLGGTVMQLLGREQYILAKMVQEGVLTDKVKSIFSLLIEKSSGYDRYHSLLEEKEPSYSDFTAPSTRTVIAALPFFAIDNSDDADASGMFTLHNSTIVFFAPTDLGIRTAVASLHWLKEYNSGVRVALSVNIPTVLQSCLVDQRCSAEDSFGTIATMTVVNSLAKLCQRSSCGNVESVQMMIDALEILLQPTGETLNKDMSPDTDNWLVEAITTSRKLQDILDTSDDQTVVSYNTRKVIVTAETPFLLQDFVLLSSIEEKKVSSSLAALLSSSGGRNKHSSNDFLCMISFIGRYGIAGGGRFNIDRILEELEFGSGNVFVKELEPKQSVVMSETGELVVDELDFVDRSDILIHVVVDPLSLAGQRAASLMKIIRDQLRLPQIAIFTPRFEMNEFPLQNFFRYVTGSLRSDRNENSAIFRSLPKQHILTVRLDTPESWNVQSIEAVQDPDNLRCDSVGCGDVATKDTTRVGYTLRSLLVVGQCYQPTPGAYGGVPPNGLQLTLTRSGAADNSSSKVQTDTLVMQNLGYFQLQASPGFWRLNLAEGRATELFSIVDGEKGILYPVRTFADDMKRLLVSKRPGMEDVSLLDDPRASSSDSADIGGRKMGGKKSIKRKSNHAQDIVTESAGKAWNSLTGFFSPATSATPLPTSQEDNKIHVFSLATGHMYERLLRIMMLSVSKRTSMPVKFWLFENYLSPTFKGIAAVMAEEYGFEVDYVTYKWPEWLQQQTQKQRIIWGYKILFLDVLFPLNVKKVIYVDADQVLRADLAELWNIDLKGKPYAYTPFCSSREETLGFQFWRSGYWADHLQGRPYHISALYVVDLQNFRRNAVGDQLRAVYNNLAKDPNSLANLDQDLPNYAQHSVPIHSLPQEWLWCETWCSESSKVKAKTIDLCNSPLNKEPKLDMARRIISGRLFNESWIELDDEVRALERRRGFVSSE